MEYNEKAVVIGNEAQVSRLGPEDEDRLLGIDMLCLTLEHSGNVKETISIITFLLEEYG